MDKHTALNIQNKLATFPEKELFATAPKPVKREITEAQGQRLLLSQLLVMALESNTRALIDQHCWPSKADKLVGALHHRIDELYTRFFNYTSPEQSEWLNKVSGLIDGAAVSILKVAIDLDKEHNGEKVEQFVGHLREIALLAGVYQQDDEQEVK
ncbi:hypothetical protein [Hymenobacter fodinae]|uniref:Uncharacterized protein n=1 Tax=Hymenobacter fodinae TaxID=2510796 RepID=A0A4Z0P776_9BACT|nr:hypothetical protein [Hymenobacter fodinae]TGE08274.1 hypothetical protein EU556_11170 [Hymenobacter fodinae]